MRKRFVFFVCLIVLAYSCADEAGLVQKETGTRNDKLNAFISELQKENLAADVFEKRVDQFLTNQGATCVSEGSNQEELTHKLNTLNAKEPECVVKSKVYSFDKDELTWVIMVSGCSSYCNGGNGVIIEEVTFVNNVRKVISRELHCLDAAKELA